MMLPPFALPTYDVAYCSVFASFPLVGAKRHHKDHRRRGPPGLRKFERQSCRYTAVFSWQSCNTCCKIASRRCADESCNEPGITGGAVRFDQIFLFLSMDFKRSSRSVPRKKVKRPYNVFAAHQKCIETSDIRRKINSSVLM
ncbi:hypothetical protein OSTOST_19555 [Ostertagia ostertagi]